MTRIIRIDTCERCPYIGHKGGFGKIAYIPRCELTGNELPYTESARNGHVYAHPTYAIPETCTLERLP